MIIQWARAISISGNYFTHQQDTHWRSYFTCSPLCTPGPLLCLPRHCHVRHSCLLRRNYPQHPQPYWNFISMKRILGYKWIFCSKLHPDGSTVRNKALLIAQGYWQAHGVNYTKTFSSAIKVIAIHLLLSTFISRNWIFHPLDMSSAFLHGDQSENSLHDSNSQLHSDGSIHTWCRHQCRKQWLGFLWSDNSHPTMASSLQWAETLSWIHAHVSLLVSDAYHQLYWRTHNYHGNP